MHTSREVKNFASQKCRLTPDLQTVFLMSQSPIKNI